MSDHDARAGAADLSDAAPESRQGWFAAGGIAGAILASSCCIVPLVLVTAGVSGAWIGGLASLEPYKPYFAAFSLIFIGLGFWRVYFGVRPGCAAGDYCSKPRSSVITQTALWSATALVLLALTINWWAPLFY